VDRDRLFVELDLNAALEGHARGLDEEIEKSPEDHLLQVDEDEWVAALVARYTIATPELRPDDWWMEQAETQVDVSWDQNRAILDPSQPAYVPGHRVEVHIPFSGEKDVFKYRPSSWTTVLPAAEVRDGELVQGQTQGQTQGLSPWGSFRLGYAAWMSQPRYIRASTASVTNAVASRALANV
jgi:hypothetical protein